MDGNQTTNELLDAACEADARAACVDWLSDEMDRAPWVTDSFMSDIHGDAPAFDHLVRSASGETRALVERACANRLDANQSDALCAALYHPEAPGVPTALATLAAQVRAHGTGAFHLVGDLWDRGARGDDVTDVLMGIPQADIQWGNHDICWMGAGAGDPVCIATCVRNNVKYGNVAQFEEGYAIDLEPLFALGRELYADDGVMTPAMKAISAILFKVEGQAVLRHPEWAMEDRLLWGAMDLTRGVVPVYGVEQPLKTVDFPTFDPADPYALSPEEQRVLDGLVKAFTQSERLRAQIQWLYDHGSVYKICSAGEALAFHGCVPLNEDGTFARVNCGEGTYAGRALLDWVDALCRRAWTERDQWSLDWMGQLWCGWQSTFAGRVVKTFERTYIEDKETWKEPEDPYYALTREDAAPCERILAEFGVDPQVGFIVNGHTPVKLPKGEKPVRAGGKRIVIDGGLCAAYRKTTGIAGYTLLRDERGGLRLVAHGEYPGRAAVLEQDADVTHEVERLR